MDLRLQMVLEMVAETLAATLNQLKSSSTRKILTVGVLWELKRKEAGVKLPATCIWLLHYPEGATTNPKMFSGPFWPPHEKCLGSASSLSLT